jgi:hypothetical protein
MDENPGKRKAAEPEDVVKDVPAGDAAAPEAVSAAPTAADLENIAATKRARLSESLESAEAAAKKVGEE